MIFIYYDVCSSEKTPEIKKPALNSPAKRRLKNCWMPATLQKISFITGIFQRLWLQRSEHLFLRICFSGCFRIFVIAVCQVHYFCKRIQEFFQQYPWCKLWNIVKKRLQHKCFPVNMARFLRTPILENFCERLLLKILMFFYKTLF